MDFNARTVRVNGLTLNVIDEGQGPTVLLVHGFPDDHQVWRHQIPALVEAGYRVIAPDMRGCGESDAPAAVSAYHVDRFNEDLAALLDELDIPQVLLVGHDWGAIIGWSFAMAHPARVQRYLALSVGHPLIYATGGLEQKLKGWYTIFFQFRGLTEKVLRFNDWWLFRSTIRQPAEVDHWIAKLQRPGRLTAGLNYYRANIGLLFRRRYPAVQMPVMGVWSDGDHFLSEQQMTDSESQVPAGWRYERLEGVSHWMQLDAPERVNALMLEFLAGDTA